MVVNDGNTAEGTPRVTDRHDYAVAIALAALTVIAGAAVITFGVCGVYHDDAVYVSTAKALAEGRGYRLINLPAAPLQTRYPILYPAGLAIIWRSWPAFPANLAVLQSVSVVMSAASIALGYLYARRVQRSPRLIAAFGLALCATAPTFAYFSTQTLSEIPFALTLIVVLWIVAAELGRSPSTRRRDIVVGLAIAVPALIRLVGLAIVLPTLWTLWRRNRRIAGYAVGTLVALAAWFGWVYWARQGAAAARIAMNTPDSWDWFGSLVSRGLRHTAGYNALILTVATADIFPAGWKARIGIAFPILGLITWVAVATRVRRGVAPPLIAYAALIVVWPWPPGRFLVPLWPLLGPFTFDLIYRRVGRVVTACVAMLAVAGNVIGLYEMSARNRAAHYPTLLGVPAPPHWSAFQRAFEWIRSHTGPNDIVFAGLDPMVFLYTGRTSMRPFDLQPLPLFYGAPGNAVGTSGEMVSVLVRQDRQYVLQTPMPGFSEEKPFEQLLTELREQRPGCLEPVYRDDQDDRFVIFAVHADACR
jgi:hypothetical protein